VFITTEGKIFRDAKKKVLEFVRSSENYTESDVEGIEMFHEIEYSRRIAEKYEWVENDENVPEGWKYRISNEKMHFLSPEGRTFSNRIAAFKYLSSSESSEKQIEDMRATFKHEGWFGDELLPKGWMYKVQTNGSRWSINFLSKDGLELNDGQGRVMEFLGGTPEYSDDDLQRMEMFFEIQNNKQRKLKYEWLEDEEVIPYGWKFRVCEGKKSKMFFLSPDGQEFNSRHSALKHMIDYSYQDEEIEEMRNSLRAEGWIVNACLPSGWRIKSPNTDKKFLSRSGEIIKGFSAALASIRENENYNHSDILNFQKLQRELSWAWMEDDDTVPYGWKVCSANMNLHQNLIMSPDGVQFESRTFAFQHLIKTDADELEIEDMREKLVHEGWMESPFLIDGWRYKKSFEVVHFLSKDGELFEKNSFDKASEFMKNSQLYTEEDINKLRLFLTHETSPTNDQNMDTTSHFDQNNDQTYPFDQGTDTIYPQITDSTYPYDDHSTEEWVHSDSIPEGWKVKLKDGRNYGRMSFMSPNGNTYRSRKVALQSLLGAGCSEEEAAPLRKMLVHEDWKESELLPSNWLYKLAVDKVSILTETGKEVESKRAALDVIKDSKHFEKLDMFYEMISAHKQLSRYEWMEGSETVPEGWRIRNVKGSSGKTSLLSPSGNAYSSRKIALQSMINMGSAKKDIDAMRSKLVHEGWTNSELLPNNWVYKVFSAHTQIIITEDGKEVSSKETTIDYMKKSVKPYSTEDFDRMKIFFDMTFAKKRMLRHGWKDDQSVPVGWKVNSKNTLMSPEGICYPNRKMALKALIKNRRTDEDIDEMRSKMCYDGWKTSDMLPKKWLFKRFGTKTVIVTSEGEETDSKQSAVSEMKSHNYSKEDLERLETFYDMVYAEGRLSNSAWLEDPESLPSGWKYRVVNKSGKCNFLCPEGLSFTSRKAGYQHMIETKYDPEEIDEMRKMLVHESWQFHDLLPMDWMYKSLQYGSGSRKTVHVLTGEGTEMKDSRLMVTDFMRSLDRYDMEDIRKLNHFFEAELGKTQSIIKQEKPEWIERSPTLPEGWKIKKGEGNKESFLSPDNIVFTSRCQSLKHMLSTVFYTEKQIDEMRSLLGIEGWKKDANLPRNWMFKENGPGSRTPVILITPEGEVLESMKAGLDFIKTIYNDKDVAKMQRFMRDNSTYYKHKLETRSEAVEQEISRLPDSLSDEDIEFDDAETDEEEMDRKMENKSALSMHQIKQEVITTPKKILGSNPEHPVLKTVQSDALLKSATSSKSVLDTTELEMLLSRGNFTTSLVNQIQSERRRSQHDLDMEELVSVLTEGKFIPDIVDQIMRKMNNPTNSINLNSIGMQESRKRKTEEWEGELRRFRRRFAI